MTRITGSITAIIRSAPTHGRTGNCGTPWETTVELELDEEVEEDDTDVELELYEVAVEDTAVEIELDEDDVEVIDVEMAADANSRTRELPLSETHRLPEASKAKSTGAPTDVWVVLNDSVLKAA